MRVAGGVAFGCICWPHLQFDAVLPTSGLVIHAAPGAEFVAGVCLGWIGATLTGWLLEGWRRVRAWQARNRHPGPAYRPAGGPGPARRIAPPA